MGNYDVNWMGLDRGHENLWEPDVWYGVIVAVHETASIDYQNPQNDLYKKLQSLFPNIQWVSRESSGNSRAMFRDGREPWTRTEVLEFEQTGNISVSSNGQKIIANELSYNDVLLETLAKYQENGENPFGIIATAFRELGNNCALSLSQILKNIMQHYRPGSDSIHEIISVDFSDEIPTVTERRVKFMLKQLVQVGALISAKKGALFMPGCQSILHRLSLPDLSISQPKSSCKVRNRIFFGAPGTGKSYQLKEEAKQTFTENNTERVTFYPNYSYAQFVGTYKPITEGKDIVYAYVPGPFMRQWIRAKQNPNESVLLIVEELNRANAPAVFGDMFQLLDRKQGVSEYTVATNEDLRKYLKSILSKEEKAQEGRADWEWLPYNTEINNIALPANLFIWTTMNSADQGVFPLDTAFKRRWDNVYIGINEKQDVIADSNFHFSGGFYNWNEFRKKINALLTSCRVNEDKLIGPFFLNPLGLSDEQFIDGFKSKVLMYLYEDAARQCRSSVFTEDFNKKPRTYSEICTAFDEIGTGIFKGIELTVIPLTEDTSLDNEQKTDLQDFAKYLNEKTTLGEDTKKGYLSWVGVIFNLLKEKGISLTDALEDSSIVISEIKEKYHNERTQNNYCSGWKNFVDFKKNNSPGTQE